VVLDLVEPRPHLGGERRALALAHRLQLVERRRERALDAREDLRAPVRSTPRFTSTRPRERRSPMRLRISASMLDSSEPARR
jgi:hypothetical protein